MGSPESCVAAAQCSCARMVHRKAKVASSLTDVWQQLFEQQDITSGCMKTTPVHQRLETDWNRHAGTCLSETSDGRQWAEAASYWNVVSNQQSLDETIDQWQDCFNACLKAKKQTLNICFCLTGTVTTFIPYVTAVINKLTYVSFHKVGWEQSSGEVDNLVAVLLQIYLLQIYFGICMPKIIEK